jgi:hypothetical protein
MSEDDLLIFELYRHQREAGGPSRDNLPYTRQFWEMRLEYNRRASEPLEPDAFWRKFLKVLKRGEGELARALLDRGPVA